ncbi:SMI1/KNR4 family protein [Streptomyces sp. ST1015]|uniref:SMI1/KNR4 family protein n=1 Tax=unclassified Streptomyces TaxID=2593676 RepID=UPI001CA7349D|nr:SMI1/KNR4 family protein [Streptomyces sp. ST1015]QZZ25446.1 SMI1/KNR4 family protein [Streptomyces sp. ST1015]
MRNYDWRPFLSRWSEEWADASDEPSPQRDARWLGFAGASEERISALEERLRCRLPPSYRDFLAVSDGWLHAGCFVWRLAGVDEVGPYSDDAGLGEIYRGELDEHSTPAEVLEAGMWGRALQLEAESDLTKVLLDPGDVGPDGEWACYDYASWRGDGPVRYGSFAGFMEAMYRQFHSMTARSSGPEFVNATTLAQDAAVARARVDALRGRYEEARAALDEAHAYGRPGATELRDQLTYLSGEPSTVSFGALATDPLYQPEVRPVLAAARLRLRHWEADADFLDTYGYSAPGVFGEAVEAAREAARWGDTDAAWRILRAALPEWRPAGPDLLAPLGLLADPVLGPVCTPERCRELLATPRAGETGEVPLPTPDLDPPGLSWLVDPDSGDRLSSYRLILVEGVEPTELPARIGGADLGKPATYWEAHLDASRFSVGRAGPDWSFAFEAAPHHRFYEPRFVSPAPAASFGTRAVAVWREADGSALFHLSVAEDGAERYAFTVRGDEVRRTGAIPASLDAGPVGEWLADERRVGERRVLEFLAGEFGVRLPRHALLHGRLHTLVPRPWARPAGPGEGYADVTVGTAPAKIPGGRFARE